MALTFRNKNLTTDPFFRKMNDPKLLIRYDNNRLNVKHREPQTSSHRLLYLRRYKLPGHANAVCRLQLCLTVGAKVSR